MRSAVVAILTLLILSCKTGIEYPEGGYDYVKDYKDADTGFYFLPVRDSFSREDSFWNAFDGDFLYSKLHEPNLSLHPAPTDIFRLITYTEEKAPIIITVSKEKIYIKTNHGNDPPCIFDTNNLTPLERTHFKILERHFPVTKENIRERYWPYYDSIARVNPALRDPKYYYLLLKKGYCNDIKYKYSIDTLSITPDQFKTLVTAINRSGYWKMPVNPNCDHYDCTHSAPLLLEANTRNKYNYVSSYDCCDDSLGIVFAQTCQLLVKLAGLEKEITVDWYSNAKIDSGASSLKVHDIQLEEIQISSKKKKHD